MFLVFHYFSSLLNICVILKTMGGLAKQVDLFKHWKLLGSRMNYEYKILEARSTRKIKENLP